MSEPTITCPGCQIEIRLTESLAAPLLAETRRQFQHQLAQQERAVAARERHLREREQQLTDARRELDTEVASAVESALASERAALIAEEARKARLATAVELDTKARELAELNELLQARDAKLAEAQQAQADLLRRQRELDDAKRELELTVEKRVQDALGTARAQARREAEESLKLRVMEKDHTIASMQQTIEELKRKAEQGSQQLQGEVQELELEELLRVKFPWDRIEPVPKGEFGGDTLQRVNEGGLACGSILWEAKRTKHWSDAWLVKLRDDQRAARADVAVLVTQTLPKGIETFDVVDGVWITGSRAALPVATILRHTLWQVSRARQAGEGQQTKTELIYQYLTGPRFRHRVEAIVEAFTAMQEDLDRERKMLTRQWAKRSAQIERVMTSTVGMYGDLQGIAGKSLQEIEGLEPEALPAPDAAAPLQLGLDDEDASS